MQLANIFELIQPHESLVKGNVSRSHSLYSREEIFSGVSDNLPVGMHMMPLSLMMYLIQLAGSLILSDKNH